MRRASPPRSSSWPSGQGVRCSEVASGLDHGREGRPDLVPSACLQPTVGIDPEALGRQDGEGRLESPLDLVRVGTRGE